MDKVFHSAAAAVTDIGRGARLAVGGFGLSGIPHVLIEAVHQCGAGDLDIVSNNCGVDDGGLGLTLRELAPGVCVGDVRHRTAAPVIIPAEFTTASGAPAEGLS
jgi:acyl CoA:acetate/3-ketoacid CoA transferase